MDLPLLSAEHFAVMSVFRKATRSTWCLRVNGTFACQWDPSR